MSLRLLTAREKTLWDRTIELVQNISVIVILRNGISRVVLLQVTIFFFNISSKSV